VRKVSGVNSRRGGIKKVIEMIDIRVNIHVETLERFGWRHRRLGEAGMSFEEIKGFCEDMVKQGYYVIMYKTPYTSPVKGKGYPFWVIFWRKRRDWKKPRLKIVYSLDYLNRYNEKVSKLVKQTEQKIKRR